MTKTMETILGDIYDAWRAQDLEWLASYLPDDFYHVMHIPWRSVRSAGAARVSCTCLTDGARWCLRILFASTPAICDQQNCRRGGNSTLQFRFKLLGARSSIHPEDQANARHGQQHELAFRGLGDAFANPALRASFAIGFCILFAFIGTFTFVNFVLVQPPLGVGAMTLGFVYFVFVPAMATTPLAGHAVKRFYHPPSGRSRPVGR